MPRLPFSRQPTMPRGSGFPSSAGLLFVLALLALVGVVVAVSLKGPAWLIVLVRSSPIMALVKLLFLLYGISWLAGGDG